MKVIVSGATGLIGRHLVAALAGRGDEIVALSRGQGKSTPVPGARTVSWRIADGVPRDERRGACAIVNLAGANIGTKRWSDSRRLEIMDSRIASTRACVAALSEGGPSILINASAIGYYGSTEHEVDESAPAGDDFLASVCVAWEDEALRGEQSGARVVRLRTGIVLAADGGVLERLLLPAKLGANGPLGSGHQWQSWIHIADQVGIILHALDTTTINGPINSTAPNPVRQRDFARALGHVIHRPSFVPAPAFALRALLGSGPASLALEGQRVIPRIALDSGYRFRFPDLEPALRDLLA